MREDGSGGNKPVEDIVIGLDIAIVFLFAGFDDVRTGCLAALIEVGVEIDCQLTEGAIVITVDSMTGFDILILFIATHQPVVEQTIGKYIAMGLTFIAV